jgi:hypothetical protein
MDGFADWLDHITDDRGLLSLFVCNEAVVPGRIYASYRRRHGVVLCTGISTLGNACTATVRIPNPSACSRRYRILIRIVVRAL